MGMHVCAYATPVVNILIFGKNVSNDPYQNLYGSVATPYLMCILDNLYNRM